MSHILIIEDNHDLARGLANNLEIEGYGVDIVHDGSEGLARARPREPALVSLDRGLHGRDGYRVLSSPRAAGNGVPALILTARSGDAAKGRAFCCRAAHYVTQ